MPLLEVFIDTRYKLLVVYMLCKYIPRLSFYSHHSVFWSTKVFFLIFVCLFVFWDSLALCPKVSLNSQSSLLSFPGAGITGLCHMAPAQNKFDEVLFSHFVIFNCSIYICDSFPVFCFVCFINNVRQVSSFILLHVVIQLPCVIYCNGYSLFPLWIILEIWLKISWFLIYRIFFWSLNSVTLDLFFSP
jgi:hypothetical protein